jgi:hypothetical protein
MFTGAASNSFTVTLLSNSSLDIYEDNNLTHFRNQIDPPIELSEGGWHVGLVQINFPASLRKTFNGEIIYGCEVEEGIKDMYPIADMAPYNAHATKRGITIEKQNIQEKVSKQFKYVPPAESTTDTTVKRLKAKGVQLDENNVYGNIDQYIAEINTILRKEKIFQERKKSTDNKLFEYPFSITLDPHLKIIMRDDLFFVLLDWRIARPLGFNVVDNQYIEFKKSGVYNYAYHKPSLTWARPRFFFVYLNIIEYGIVGGRTRAPLLRTVHMPADNEKEENVWITYTPIVYIPVSVRTLDTIEVDIRSPTGAPMAFDYGLIEMLLHFVRK